MSGTSDKIKGAANEATGGIKQAVGKVVGSDRLEAEGAIQKAKGQVQQAVGKGKEAVKSAVDNT
jgi:uncharacterized protein YjbJ (UPF0337 family)